MNRFGMIGFALLGLSLGCGSGALDAQPQQPAPEAPAPTVSGPAAPAPVDPTPSEPTPVAPAPTPTPTSTQGASHCATDGAFGFHVFASGLSWEGHKIVASAIENHGFSSTQTQRHPVLISTQIQGGAFSIDCPNSLLETYAYPSYAVYVDVDQDGKCSAGDVGMQMLLYGWNQAVEDDLGVTNDWNHFAPVGELAPALGGGGTNGDFCKSYFL